MTGTATPHSAPGRWFPVIGLEIHVQLATATKMFCRCEARYGAPPNTLVCPVCTAQPGTLPVLNAEAVRLGVLAGLAIGCEIDTVLEFDRKNYYYPDLPKGYQISQYDRPLCHDGRFAFELPDGSRREITIQRAHLEEDSGKVIHPEGLDLSLVDLNRAGTPLLEIVSGPDLRSPAEASAYLQAMRQTLRYAGVSDCDMEKGSFRCDANLSLRPSEDAPFGTRTEVKNLNSFRFVEAALNAEIERQSAVLDAGGTVIQATLGFDPDSGLTTQLRTKEEVHDYRYFREPDLPAFAVTADWIEQLRGVLPESPVARHQRYVGVFALAPEHADALVADKALGDFLDATVDAGASPGSAARWILSEVLRLANAAKRPLDELAITPARVAEVVALVDAGQLSLQASRHLATAVEGQPEVAVRELAEALDLLQVSGADELTGVVREVLAVEADLVARYRGGKTELFHALLGAVMKASRGKANPGTVRELLERELA